MGIVSDFKNLSPKKQQSLIASWIIGIGIVMIVFSILMFIKIVEYKVYKSEKYGIQIKYPMHWTPVDTSTMVQRAICGFVAPKESPMDEFQENVNISYYDLRGPESLEDFVKRAAKQVDQAFMGYMEVAERKSVRIGGRQGYQFTYMGKLEGVDNPLKYLNAIVILGNRAFIIGYTAQKKSYNKYINEVNTMIQSFGPIQNP